MVCRDKEYGALFITVRERGGGVYVLLYVAVVLSNARSCSCFYSSASRGLVRDDPGETFLEGCRHVSSARARIRRELEGSSSRDGVRVRRVSLARLSRKWF